MLMLTPQDIARLRKELGLSPTQFAAKLGVSENTVRRWEIGDRHPRYNMMVTLNEMSEQSASTAAAS